MGRSAYLFAAAALGLVAGPAAADARSDGTRSTDECPYKKSQAGEPRTDLKMLKATIAKPKLKRRYILM